MLELAQVPGADVLVRVDFKALSQVPMHGTAEDLIDQQKMLMPWTRAIERALQAMGLKKEDVVAALMSLDLDTVAMSHRDGSAADYEKASMALALQVVKPVTPAQLHAGLTAAAGNRTGITVSEIIVAGRRVISAKSPDPAAPIIYVAVSADGRILFATLNAAAMEALFHRERKGTIEVLSPTLVLAAGDLVGAQIQASVALPEGARQALREALDRPRSSGELGWLLAMGLMNPVKSLVSLACGFAFRQDLVVTLALGFEDDASAQQAHALVQGILVPMLRNAAQSDQGGQTVALDKAVSCMIKGRNVVVTLALTEGDLRSVWGKKVVAAGPQEREY